MEKINELVDTIISQFKDNKDSIIGMSISMKAVDCKIEIIDKKIADCQKRLNENRYNGMMLRLLEDEILDNENELKKLRQ